MANRIPYKITDEAVLREAYPELFREETVTVTNTIIDREKLYALVKFSDKLGRDVPGVAIRPAKPAAAADGGAAGESAPSATKDGATGPDAADSTATTGSASTSEKSDD